MSPIFLFIIKILEFPMFQVGLSINELTDIYSATKGKQLDRSSYNSVSLRLNKMYENELLCKFRPSTEIKSCYYINKKSMSSLNEWIDTYEIKPRPSMISVSHHRLGAKTMCKLIASGIRSGVIKTYGFLESFNLQVSKEEKERLRPDGILRINGKVYFVEIDNGTESKKQLEHKLFKIIAFLKNNSEIQILFVPRKYSRTKSIFEISKSILENLENKIFDHISKRIHFSSAEQISDDFNSGWINANIDHDINKSDFIRGIAE